MSVSRISIDPEDHYRGFCLQVGHLFMSWARLEGLLSGILKLHLANNVSEDTSQTRTIALSSAVYGSMRFKAARDTINRILTTEPARKTRAARLTAIFAHLGNIEKLRDYLAHQQISPVRQPMDGNWQISTLFSAKDLTKTAFFHFNTAAVNAASSDLTEALIRLGGRDVGTSLIDALIGDASPIAWQYKPSMLRQVHQSKAIPPPELEPQLPPSP